jgi:hypothetical protein
VKHNELPEISFSWESVIIFGIKTSQLINYRKAATKLKRILGSINADPPDRCAGK